VLELHELLVEDRQALRGDGLPLRDVTSAEDAVDVVEREPGGRRVLLGITAIAP